jgi:hypothetical protein
MSCACRREGASCGPSCECAHYDFRWGSRAQRCRSPFSRLPEIFTSMPARRIVPLGLTPAWCDMRANPCFKKHLNLESKKERQLDVDGLVTKIMADSEAWRTDTFLKDLRPRLLDDTTNEQEKKGSRTSLMEYALGKREEEGKMELMMTHLDSHVWSFCRDQWVSRIGCRHCEDCDICYDDAWHCRACGTCKVGHWFICDGCGGKSSTGATYGVLEGGTTEDARTARGGLSLGRPKKRSRHVDSDNGLGSISEVSHLQSLFAFDTTDIFTTQTKLEAPKDILTRPCDCKYLCSTRRCLCRRWGGSCKHNCKCSGCKDAPPLGCQNPFRYSEYRYFGPRFLGSLCHEQPRASPTTWRRPSKLAIVLFRATIAQEYPSRPWRKP